MTFDEAFDALLKHEGGYSNHGADPGGKTRWGVTESVARAEGFTGDMTAYPLAEARKVYRKLYWDAMRLSEVPAELRFELFDAAVNSGVGQATKWAQRVLVVPADGVMGPVTLNALKITNIDRFLRKFVGQRLIFMTNLAHWNSFSRGWARRIAENLIR